MKYALAPTFLIAVVLFSTAGCGSAPKIPKADQLPAYSSQPYAQVLAASVKDGMVDYPAITGDLDHKLDIYLDALARFGPKSTPEQFATRDDELAYYLNAYNAIMIRLWLDKGARTTPKDDGVNWLTWFTVNQWKIDQRGMSLDYLEQRLIRPRYDEGRIHAALVCGAVDCPPLRDEPFTGDKLDAQLDGQMSDWLNHPAEDAIIINDDGKVYLAAIFGWYREDFRDTGGLENVIQQYLNDSDPRKEQVLAAIRDKKIKFQGYDWTINLPGNATGPAEIRSPKSE